MVTISLHFRKIERKCYSLVKVSTRSKLFQIMDLVGSDQESKSYLNLILNDIWNKTKIKISLAC